jgi:hypothetical protein
MEPDCEFEACGEFPAHEGRLLCHTHHPAGHHDAARCSSIIHPEDRGEPVIVMSVGVMEGVRFIQYEPGKPNYLEVTRDIARSPPRDSSRASS